MSDYTTLHVDAAELEALGYALTEGISNAEFDDLTETVAALIDIKYRLESGDNTVQRRAEAWALNDDNRERVDEMSAKAPHRAALSDFLNGYFVDHDAPFTPSEMREINFYEMAKVVRS